MKRNYSFYSYSSMYILLFFYIQSIIWNSSYGYSTKKLKKNDNSNNNNNDLNWLVHEPKNFQKNMGKGVDVRSNEEEMKVFLDFYQTTMHGPLGGREGENVDVVEHFFWGLKQGTALELRGFDGSASKGSMTAELSTMLKWKRILVEPEVAHRNNMKTYSPDAFSVNAAICPKEQTITVRTRKGGTQSIPCIPLSSIITSSKVPHFNYFLLSVEGREMDVLRTVDFGRVTIDVISIETEGASRSVDFGDKIEDFLRLRGYTVHARVGRNRWFVRKGFTPLTRPGLKPGCWNGYLRASHAPKHERTHCVADPENATNMHDHSKSVEHAKMAEIPSWIVNYPPAFAHRLPGSRDVRNNPDEMNSFLDYYNATIHGPKVGVDGENVDVVEHFFWGLKDGVSIELGALDGSVREGSMTYELHGKLNWNRIIIEADPIHRENMKIRSPDAYAINAAICKKDQLVHYSHRGYVGGILELMSDEFMKSFAPAVYQAGTPPGNLSSIQDWTKVKQGVTEIRCLPISKILSYAHIHHVNYFLLDVEGAELEVLESFNFDKVTVDVLSVETEAGFRPIGYGDRVIEFMKQKGYEVFAEIGRNHWFIRKGFSPMTRPGLRPNCWNGVLTFRPQMKGDRPSCAVDPSKNPLSSSLSLDSSPTPALPTTPQMNDLPSWVVQYPSAFMNRLPSSRDVRNNPEEMKSFFEYYNATIDEQKEGSDGENVDVIEHFFWGLKYGVALELGSSDGSVQEGSMTYELQQKLKWNRILIEADPAYRGNMKIRSPNTYAINAAICHVKDHHHVVHYAYKGRFGGILEFMSEEYLKKYTPEVYKAGSPPGNVSSIQDWSKIRQATSTVKCLPLSKVLSFAHVYHVNFLLLSVNGAEFEVLQTFNFEKVTIDVLCIETDSSFRPIGFAEKIIDFMRGKGYEVQTQIGKNHWFVRRGFTPMPRIGLKPNCWNGFLSSHNAKESERNYCLVPTST